MVGILKTEPNKNKTKINNTGPQKNQKEKTKKKRKVSEADQFKTLFNRHKKTQLKFLAIAPKRRVQ